jgi:flagellin
MSTFSQINTNIQSMQAFQSLQNTSSELSMRRERLSTGLRINSAEDDSAGFAIAKKLEAETRGQGQALKNITDAKSMLTVAEGGLNSTLDILQTMKEKAVQAANDSLGSSERNAIQGQLEELTKEISDIVSTTNFNGNQLLDGTGGQAGDGKLNFQVGAESSETFEVQMESAETGDVGITQDSSATNANELLFEGDFGNPDASTSLSLATTGNLDLDVEKELTITVSGSATDAEITVSDGETTNTIDGGGTLDLTTDDVIDIMDTDGSLASGTAQSGSANALELDFSQFSEAQINDAINEGGSITVRATDSTLDVSDSGSAGSAIDTIDSAINEVTDQLAGIGDSQKRLSFKGENLETARTNLESARSGIEDADFAREQMQIAKLQILQQTGTATLAQANASSQGVLSLIGGG